MGIPSCPPLKDTPGPVAIYSHRTFSFIHTFLRISVV